jgi:hypothetical protein
VLLLQLVCIRYSAALFASIVVLNLSVTFGSNEAHDRARHGAIAETTREGNDGSVGLFDGSVGPILADPAGFAA